MRKPQIFLNLAIAVILFFTFSAALAQPQVPYTLGETTLTGPVKLELRRRPPPSLAIAAAIG